MRSAQALTVSAKVDDLSELGPVAPAVSAREVRAVAGAGEVRASSVDSERDSHELASIKLPSVVAVREGSHPKLRPDGKTSYYKAVFLGNSDTPKTKLIRMISGNPKGLRTIGMDFVISTIEMPAGREVKYQIWDTTGQERFRCIGNYYFRDANAIFIMGDNVASIKHWIEECKRGAPGVSFYTIHQLPVLKLEPLSDESLARAVSQEVVSKSRQHYIGQGMIAAATLHLSRDPAPVPFVPSEAIVVAGSGAGAAMSAKAKFSFGFDWGHLFGRAEKNALITASSAVSASAAAAVERPTVILSKGSVQ